MELAEVRTRRALSVRALASLANVSARTIYGIEHGQVMPTLATIRKLSRALEIEPVEVDEFRAVIERILGKDMGRAALVGS
jgi:transcriptional regulator with XRE-family HTH domain